MCFTGFNELIGKQYRTFAILYLFSESNHTQRQNFVVPTSIIFNLTLIITIHIHTLLLA